MNKTPMIPLLTLFLIFCLGTSSVPSAEAGAITGTIRYMGPRPNPRPIATSTDPVCPGQVQPNTLVIGTQNELVNVLVHVVDGVPPGNYRPPSTPVTVSQAGCRYVPHVFAAMIGQQVVFTSSDPTLHTVDLHTRTNPKSATSLPRGVRGFGRRFDKEEYMFPVMCSVHPWMLAFGNVLPHPYFFVSDEQGRYLLQDLPVGTYTIEAWHEQLGQQTKTVTISRPEEFVREDFMFPGR